MLDNGLAAMEARLAEKRETELQARTEEVERQLRVITAHLGLLWQEVTGMRRPMPSGIQLTMTTEEHVATAETHLRYAEGHLKPREEHLADTEVHLKLVRAHLAILEPTRQAEIHLIETVPPPMPGVPTREAELAPVAARKVPTKRAKAVSLSKKGVPTKEAKWCLC